MFVLNLYILEFGFVSDFDIRISSLCYINSTNSYVRIYNQIMQNKPNVKDAIINVNSLLTTDYENKSNWTLGENKPNSNPIILLVIRVMPTRLLTFRLSKL